MSYLHLVINHGCPIWTPLGLEKLSSPSEGQAHSKGSRTQIPIVPQPLSRVATGLALGGESGKDGNPGPQNQNKHCHPLSLQREEQPTNHLMSLLWRSACSWGHFNPGVLLYVCGEGPQAVSPLARTRIQCTLLSWGQAF